jgi:hypothetical protein
MKSKLILLLRVVLSAFLSFLWLVLIQGEYEMITKPELQNDFPVIKGLYAVYFLGVIILIISASIFILIMPVLKKLKIINHT